MRTGQKTGFDAALPGEGLLIWHIDESIGNNDDYLHKLVDLEEADGLNHLDNIWNSIGEMLLIPGITTSWIYCNLPRPIHIFTMVVIAGSG